MSTFKVNVTRSENSVWSVKGLVTRNALLDISSGLKVMKKRLKFSKILSNHKVKIIQSKQWWVVKGIVTWYTHISVPARPK